MASLETEYDYIIVGAGSAGCVVAEQLTRDRDVTVCLLEAGKSDDHPHIRTPMLLKEVVSGGPFNWSYETEPQSPPQRPPPVLAARQDARRILLD